MLFGIDPDAPAPGANADVHIEVPRTELTIPGELQEEIFHFLPDVHITLKRASHFICNYIMVKNKLCSANLDYD